jgi:hypothetical protein
MNKLIIETYSEKAIAVFGESKPIKDNLSSLGGKFNPSLRGNGDEKRAGWIFPKTKLDDVKKIIDQYNSGSIDQIPVPTEKKTYTKKSESTSSFEISKEMYLSLISRIERLEEEVSLSKRIIEKLSPQIPSVTKINPNKPRQATQSLHFKDDDDEEEEEDDEKDDDEEEEQIVPQRRLLRKN